MQKGQNQLIMRKRKIWLNIVFGLIVILCIVSFGAIIMPNSSSEVVIAVISLDVALLALYISLRTFYSIDEVNAISRMDGNVMENPRYQPNILGAVFRFPQNEFKETSEKLMDYMEGLFHDKNKQSGAHLADNVQEIADLLVLIPYFIKDDSAVQLKRVSQLLNTIRNKVNNFKEISDGSCKLLEETVSLIESVFEYQKMNDSGKSDPSKILEIRGSIFINPVTSILYYDYLGLYYLKRSVSILSNKISPSLREIIICAKDCQDEEKAMALVYCTKATGAFKRAKENIGDDMILTGYVGFNLARAEYLKQFLNVSSDETSDNDWESYINESIRSWMTSNKIIAEQLSSKHPNSKKSWLQQAFISEENYVRLTKVLMQIMKQQPITDYNGNAWVDYNGLMTTTFFESIPKNDPQKLTDTLVVDIKEMIINNNKKIYNRGKRE